ncbi:MAG: BolA family transcriptional regulator [Sphingomonas bacterium]|uniref:BolA family protein n=1 Tax=Sphingomonas bacterium TaxID=1895847 RepID=UPI00261235BA|nr:BolA family protein [Sphingomonas bacterium]MDB5696755.1 BolA family transcriptional regulator [Sphingomonas bacterium]
MTQPATVASEIERRLTAALAPTMLEVLNESWKHAGHAGDDGSGESHFSVTVESASFAGLSRVARQRLVNKALADLIDPGHIHALAIRARVPGEA